ncbi:branched-chain amino acid ABC transporter permease [Umezawaea tangerina]|uniref:Amino acid/amide ABC transporter membrane protein 2 (HAAT family) n=1 Tax=Umezawaea tangerina TaxID=84725 RepID=A0A2T0T9I2_9PSEU|nr:branched-chain amino acid ABC transporter permease [Umezawaea tangerina]PRY42321.1 amino acid/amide ABC transporter membrane protein 2 (HAAT family) [Umezawaea tangerina]
MSKLANTIKPFARPLAILGGVLLIVAALLPWVTFALNSGKYPDLATLQFFDAPFAVTGFRWHILLLGVLVLIAVFAPIPSKGRVVRSLGWGGLAVALINSIFITTEGGGLGAITAADGNAAFGGIVGIVAGIAVILGGTGIGIELPAKWKVKLSTPLAYLVLVVTFAAVLFAVAQTLTAGGQGGPANPYAGGLFLSFLGFAAGLLTALNGIGLIGWISELSEKHRVFSVVVLLACALLLPFTNAGSEYWMTVAANIGIYAATAIGLNIVVGLAGLLDLGYVAFMGIGAVVAANLSGAAASKVGIDLPFPIAAVIAAIIAGIFGAIVGSPTLRVRGDYLAIVTLAFGEIFTRSAQNNIGGLTNGANAIPGVPPLDLFGKEFNEPLNIGSVELPSGVLYYVLIVLLVAAVMAIFANLKFSRIGRAWIAIREDEDAARAMGIKTGKAKILAFLVGATLAGLAGAVFAHKNGTVSYESFKFLESVTLLAAVILGGMGSIPGAVLGASLLFVLPEKLREFSDYRLMIFGLALVLIMRFRPQGLVPDRHRRAELAGEDVGGVPVDEVHEHDTKGATA